ncbi:hypothetical protein DPSP01_011004 [Paraphaeosphaeria sporulosa]|uniref:Uncharacterized protein n=1 Tax=Paraphaeosphaeria sporulosa TaxID=1460663 RepID=A0A177CL24_9PLEO|nr:uncharacterized protein CC84DRAFT_1087035 [Paraphaeosphaeria sporulosa]OAG08235.1 hypothetical protein CC84DRAFT_1087035 [Paraphaeosphaeria sporulosa]
MVLRLFIPPGEGQHYIVPKRPDPLGANATLQYAVVSSTVAAAGHATFAARYTRRVMPNKKVSGTVLFVRSSGRLGLWAIGVAAAANAYYHKSFTTIVVSQEVRRPTPPKLYEKTEQYTVEDGCLAGAAAGFVAFLPTLFMRRPTVSWWTRMIGMTNIGACTGVLLSHAYFQYTGERPKAMEELERQRRRRMLEFHHIFWDKMLMQNFDPLIQGYIRHNGVFRAYNLPAEVYDTPEKFGLPSVPAPTADTSTTTDPAAPENAAYYIPAPDWTQHLQALNAASIQSEIDDCVREKNALLREAEFVAYHLSQKQYAYVHSEHPDEADKQTRIRELQLLTIAYNRIRANADEADRRIFAGEHWLRQTAAFEAQAPREAWLADHPSVPDTESHDPSLTIAELKKLEEQFKNEVNVFESRVRSQAQEDVERREKWIKDLEDARTMLRAVDCISWELEKQVPKRKVEQKVEEKVARKVEPREGEELTKAEEAAQLGAEEKKKKVEDPPEGLSREKP